MKLFIKLIITSLIIACLPAFARDNQQYEATAYGSNTRNSYYYSEPLREINKLLWKHHQEDPGFPVIHKEYILFTGNDSVLSCLNKNDGSVVWNYTNDDNGISEDIFIHDNYVIFGDRSCFDYFAVQINSGELCVKKEGILDTVVPISLGNYLFFLANDLLSAYNDVFLSEIIKSDKIETPVWGTLIASEDNIICVSTEHWENNYVIGYDINSMRKLWRFNIDNDIYNDLYPEVEWSINYGLVSDPVIHNNNVYICAGTYLISIDLLNGKENWRYRFIDGTATDIGPPIIADNILICGTSDIVEYQWDPDKAKEVRERGHIPVPYKIKSHVYAIDLRLLQVIWEQETWRNISTASIAGDVVYFGFENNLRACDLYTGEILWEYRADSSVQDGIVIYDNVIYFRDRDNIYALQ